MLCVLQVGVRRDHVHPVSIAGDAAGAQLIQYRL